MVDFAVEQYLKQRRAIVDRALALHFKQSGRHSGTIYKAMHYGLFSGGKRLRPILMLAAGDLFGADAKSVMPFAIAMEMIHTYSLIHDDLPAMDDDDLRRGRTTVHKKFDEATAICPRSTTTFCAADSRRCTRCTATASRCSPATRS